MREPDLMAEATTLGNWLRHERERRGVTLLEISEQTKLSVPMLQGLENDDLSRWPGGIFRRAFARSYATAIGVDPDLVVRRVEAEHPTQDDSMPVVAAAAQDKRATSGIAMLGRSAETLSRAPRRAAAIAALLDLLVAGAIGLGFAAAGSRLLWPVLVIAVYHAAGVILTGRSPMLALLLDQPPPEPVAVPTSSAQERPSVPARQGPIVRAAPRVRQASRRPSRGSRNRGVA
jgi:transcriptional regulator with XRE-family HTH domain